MSDVEYPTRKVRKGSRAYRLNRLTEVRQEVASSQAVASMIDNHDASKIVVKSWS